MKESKCYTMLDQYFQSMNLERKFVERNAECESTFTGQYGSPKLNFGGKPSNYSKKHCFKKWNANRCFSHLKRNLFLLKFETRQFDQQKIRKENSFPQISFFFFFIFISIPEEKFPIHLASKIGTILRIGQNNNRKKGKI